MSTEMALIKKSGVGKLDGIKRIISNFGILHDKSKVVYTLLILYFGSEI